MSTVKPKFAWSYSALNTFKNCPRQYYHLKVAKDVPYEQNASAAYGDKMHKAIEMYGRHGTPLPGEFSFAKPMVDTILAIPGRKYWEHKVALTEALQPCEYFAKDCWFRGMIDVLVVGGNRAHLVDWKSGKSKNADVSQLELMALAVFHSFPEVTKVKAGLAFITENRFLPAVYTADRRDEYWASWLGDIERLDAAYTSGVWNAKPSGLCSGWCPVGDKCEHWKPKRY